MKFVLSSSGVALVGIPSLIANIVSFSALVVPLSSFGNSAYAAQDAATQRVSDNNNSTLYVSGDAQAMAKPDKVTISMSVETTNTTAEDALNANSEAMNTTLEALKAMGVSDNETST